MNEVEAKMPWPGKPLTKEVFLQRFVLTRAGDARNGTDGDGWAREAISAWHCIKKELKERPQ